MFTEGANNSYSNNCEICKNKEICKWVDHMNTTREKVSNIDGNSLSPIRIVLQCNSFVRKANEFMREQRG